jgi:hypothetical protein
MANPTLGISLRALGTGALDLPVAGDTAWHHVARATATLPQTATDVLYTITGGRILLVSIIGEVTTVIQTQANNTKLTFNPTATGSSTDICANLSTTADAVGTLYGITGTIANAMTENLLMAVDQGNLILSEGTIDLTCASSNTGSVKWDMFYIPLDEGATVA